MAGMAAMAEIGWSVGQWTHPPERTEPMGSALRVTAVEGSDAWRHTSYGFVHDSEHALLAPFSPGSAVEVEFDAAFTQQFDQAGVFLRAADDRWVKAGVEYSDGTLQLGAVVTHGRSDWSVAPVPDWAGQRLVVRVSWVGDAVTVGETVVVLEAMKMENALPATVGGTIKAVNFASGDSVQKNDVLAVIG